MAYSDQQLLICGAVVLAALWYFNKGDESQAKRIERFTGGGMVGGEAFSHPGVTSREASPHRLS